MTKRRTVPFPRSVYGRGADPDPRFSLANERTFLAWIRTALALIAAGTALAVLPADAREPFGRATSLLLVGLGIGAAARAWFGWCRMELSLRLDRAMPGAVFSAVLAALVVVVGVVLAVDLWR